MTRKDRRQRPAQQGARTRAPAPSRTRIWLLLPALLLITLAVYHPAWRGGMVWDDDAHLTRSGLQSLDGLRRIWLDVGATQQYYPATHSAFWILHRLWGDTTLPYHLINITLHAASAFLVALVLRRLRVPGGILAAAVFALHPVHVESVAWMTELKNTLSGVFFLASMLAYLHFEEDRRRRSYIAALALFAAALLSKSVTAMLPAVLIVLAWWQRGRLEWRRDLRPLVPFFVLAVGCAAMTVWVEHTVLGARGVEYQLGIIDRFLIAGRAVWFYFGKLLWPAHLTFIYPRWRIDPYEIRQYIYPAAAIAVLSIAWMIRKWSRTPLAAALLFCILLFPALGFINVYPFRYSFVADHFQYLATIPIIAALCGWAMAAFNQRPALTYPGQAALAIFLCGPLAVLTWTHSREYVNGDTLFRATLARNPSCWLCHNNLATPKLYGSAEDLDEALAHIQEALRLYPRGAEIHNNLGGALQRKGRLEEALAEHREAVRLNPRLVDAQYNIGVTYQAMGRLDDARAAYVGSLRVDPDHAAAHFNLGTVLLNQGRVEDALEHFSRAVALRPDDWRARNALGLILQRLGRFDESIAQHLEATRLAPEQTEAHYDLGTALAGAGRFDESALRLQDALRVAPDSAVLHDNLGTVLLRAGQTPKALAQFREALRLQPSNVAAHYHLAIALATSDHPNEAIGEFEQALMYDPNAPEIHNDLGAALANVGRIDEALTHFREALRVRPDYPDARANMDRAMRVRRASSRH